MSSSNNMHRINPESQNIAVAYARGDTLLQDLIFRPEVIKKGLDMLSKYGGELAYTPEMSQRFQTILERRYNTNQGPEQFQMPNYAPYVDKELAAFYGCYTDNDRNIQTRKESFEEQIERLVGESVRELEPELAGLAQNMQNFRNEEWGRYGIVNEVPYSHVDPNTTLLRNYNNDPWTTLDNPASTTNKSNVIDLYEGEPDYTYATPHEAWLVDQKDRFFDQQDPGGKPPLGFY